MNDKKYYNQKIINFIESIGYSHRVCNYYTISEKDGYININININYIVVDNFLYITFHKIFYFDENEYTKKDLSYVFNKYSDFVKFMSIYHQKECRKLKLNKLL